MTKQMHKIFHTLWGKDVGTPGYDKRKWMELQRYIEQLERLLDDLGFHNNE